MADKLICKEFNPGRTFMGRLPHGKDLLEAIGTFCAENDVGMGQFSMIGAVTQATYGAYDMKQQVYVTLKVTEDLEVINCIGNISIKDGAPFVHAHILFGTEEGDTFGGHLFSDTLIFAGEIFIQELAGAPLERVHDDVTGLALWNMPG